MRIELRSSVWKGSLAGLCFAFAGLYLWLATKAYLASHLGAVPESARIQKAIRLEPSNAQYHDLLGRNLALSGITMAEAISSFRTAISLNPYSAQYWLDLANAYQVTGQASEQRASVERAVEAAPTTPHVAWEAANFFLLQGDREAAFRSFRVVFASSDNDTVDAALGLCWRASGDENQILELALPASADLYLRFLRLLIHKQELTPAERVWNQLVGLHQTFPTKQAFPYLQFLLEHREVKAAQTAWQQLATMDRSLARYLPSPENLVVNSGFEETLLNGGFDWLYQPFSHVTLKLDSSESHSGTRSLSMTFDGMNPAEVGIYQLIPAHPNTDYEFSANYKAEDVETASGPRFAITDAYSAVSYVLTDDITGTTPWRMQQARFRTGEDTTLLLLKINRVPANPLIRGKLWIDDLKLIEKSSKDQDF